MLGVRLDPQTLIALRAVARLEGVTPAELARQVLAHTFDGIIEDALLGKEFHARAAEIAAAALEGREEEAQPV